MGPAAGRGARPQRATKSAARAAAEAAPAPGTGGGSLGFCGRPTPRAGEATEAQGKRWGPRPRLERAAARRR
jgi:hypothetical protein